jgi:hypothetical protein
MRWLMDKAVRMDAGGVFVLGDFGVFDHDDGGAFTSGVAVDARNKGLKVWFLPGNHENYTILDELELKRPRDEDGFVVYHEGLDSLLYSPRGHRWVWEGVRLLSLGGAYSVDKDWRIDRDLVSVVAAEEAVKRGHSPKRRDEYTRRTGHYLWWPREEITQEEMTEAADGPEVDILLTHDKPRDADPAWNRKDFPECLPTQEKIQTVVEAVKPGLNLHGHFHYPYHDHLERTDTHVYALDCDPDAGGDAKLSWGLLELWPQLYNFMWQDKEGRLHSHDFHPKDAVQQ